jgi:Protein kinase domain
MRRRLPLMAYDYSLIRRTGSATNDAIGRLAEVAEGAELDVGRIADILDDALRVPNADSLVAPWDDAAVADTIDEVRRKLGRREVFDPEDLHTWLDNHRDSPDKVRTCLSIDPPPEVVLRQVLSEAGNHKLVFEATWTLARRDVALKTYKPGSEVDLEHDLIPHPLSLRHPNVIETYHVHNRAGKVFFLERLLAHVHNDDWTAPGLDEAANLLYDLAGALALLHSERYVHGDLKPDNIGYADGNYILLDFGVCRHVGSIQAHDAPTGSLRTRAPELLAREKPMSFASDVWAVGAVIFKAVVGRFPLFSSPAEVPPPGGGRSSPEARDAFERRLRVRSENRWEQLVPRDLAKGVAHEPLRVILVRALARDPADRPTAEQLAEYCRTNLAGLVRSRGSARRFTATDEWAQLHQHLFLHGKLELLSLRKRRELMATLRRIEAAYRRANHDVTAINSAIHDLTQADAS